MKSNVENNRLIYRQNNLYVRYFGVFLLFVSLIATFSSWYLAKLFGYKEFLATVILTGIFVFLGIVFIGISYILITFKDIEMIFDGNTKTLYYSENNFAFGNKRQHSFSEIVNFGQEVTSLENGDLFSNYIHFSNAEGLEIPPLDLHKKDTQDWQLEEIKDFIKF